MSLTDEQLKRYSRHILLPEIGIAGQEKLLNSNILIIGTGGLGSPTAMYLTAAGIGHIGLVDSDCVELSNLQRQIVHLTKNIGKAKVLSAKETLNEMTPAADIITYNEMITANNITDIINNKNYDFIIDCTDNFPTKFLINDACVLLHKPFSHAGIRRFEGQSMTYVPGKGPCYRCIFKNPPPPEVVPPARQTGVLGVMGGIMGNIQATEAIKYILGIGNLLTGSLLTYNALSMQFRKIKISANDDCAVCGTNPSITKIMTCHNS